jgi:hypothetical protein
MQCVAAGAAGGGRGKGSREAGPEITFQYFDAVHESGPGKPV